MKTARGAPRPQYMGMIPQMVASFRSVARPTMGTMMIWNGMTMAKANTRYRSQERRSEGARQLPRGHGAYEDDAGHAEDGDDGGVGERTRELHLRPRLGEVGQRDRGRQADRDAA